MEITSNNKEKYIKKVLILALKSYCFRWLGEGPFNSGFNIERTVNQYDQLKMEQIKQYVYEQCFYHDNLWCVYEEIKDFKDIKDLLYYLAPRDYYNPESTLLSILRNSGKINIVNKEKSNRYFLKNNNTEDLPASRDEITRNLKTFIRSYVELIFIIEKQAFTLDDLYQYFRQEKVEYNSAKKNQIFLLLMDKKEKSIEEILSLIEGSVLKTPTQIFKDLIKTDYNRFIHIVDNYYGSKSWDNEAQLNAYLKLFDIYRQDSEKAHELGKITLDLLEKSNFDERKKRRFSRLIKRHMKGGS